jgi:DNA-binding IclR family transcriptional regulator
MKSIRTAERVADVLSCFSDAYTELRLTDVVNSIGLDKGTVSRLLSTLAAKDFVVADPITRRYRLGPVMIALARSAGGYEALGEQASGALATLRDISGETASLNIMIGSSRICVGAAESRHELRRVVETGKPLPIYAGAGGKAIMAFLPQDQIDTMLSRLALQRFTESTIVDPGRLAQELEQTRVRGYALGHGERVVGGAGIGVPVLDAGGNVIGSVGLGMPAFRFDENRIAEYVKWCQAAAIEISRRIRGM